MVVQKKSDEEITLEAVNNVVTAFGLSEQDLAEIIGSNNLSGTHEIDEKSDVGKRALSLVRIYQCLYSRFDGNMEHSRLWLTGFNSGTGGIPVEQIKDNNGLEQVMGYLEAMHYR